MCLCYTAIIKYEIEIRFYLCISDYTKKKKKILQCDDISITLSYIVVYLLIIQILDIILLFLILFLVNTHFIKIW